MTATGEHATIQDLDAFRLSTEQTKGMRGPKRDVPPRPRTRRGELFVKGPIGWPWLAAAARLPGRTLHVALTVRLLAGMQHAGPVALSSARLEEAGVSRHAAYRALHHLEEAGLVEVVRRRGRQPRVTILEL